MRKIAIFIDGPNAHSAGKALNFDLDFKKLLDYYSTKDTKVHRAYYFTPISESDEYTTIKPLVDWLDYNGYRVYTKPIKMHDGERRRTGIDVDIAVAMLEIARVVDEIVLFSGDGSLTAAVLGAQRAGARVTVVSTLKGSSPMVSDELRRAADTYVDLDDLTASICRVKKVREVDDTNEVQPGKLKSRYGIKEAIA